MTPPLGQRELRASDVPHGFQCDCGLPIAPGVRSEIFDFDGVLPTERLGELSHGNQLRLFRLNGVPNRPCTARFSLPDPSIDSSRIMEEVVSTGVERKFVKCIQRLRSGVVEITFARRQTVICF